MKKNLVFFLSFFFFSFAFGASVDSYLVGIGREYLNQGRIQEARVEFEKALQANPNNQEARQYLQQLRQRQIDRTLDRFSEQLQKDKPLTKPEIYRREPASVEPDLLVKPSFKPDEFSRLPEARQPLTKKAPSRQDFLDKPAEIPTEEDSPFYFEGDYQLSFGVESGDFIWKKAEGDLTESNWRILSEEGYNYWQSTYDPAIFSQLRLKTGYDSPDSGFGFHSFIDISPWSFLGKSDKVTIDNDAWGADSVDIQLKYWANTRYTIGDIFYTNLLGDSFALGEKKVKNRRVASFAQRSLLGNTFDIDELKIKREFWPLRELWFDFAGDNISLRVFPAALEDQAYSSDSPLQLSNRHIWWAPSPWLSQWKPGRFNPDVAVWGVPAPDFYKGFWDDSLAFRTRTSALERITNLRGFSLSIGGNNTLLDFTAASPKNLWQDYDEFDTLNTALRGKYFHSDDLMLGFTHVSKHGFESGHDAFNHVWGFDASLGLTDQTSLSVEAATSLSEYDRKSGKDKGGINYDIDKRGNVYHFNLVHSSEDPFGKHFYSVRPKKEDDPFYRIKLSFTRMDSGFDAALADYHHTRDDEFWSRHLTFRRQFAYEYFGLYGPPITEEDQLYPFRIGDGIDSGRNVVSLRWEAENIVSQNLDLLFDIRDVRENSGGLIENVSRLQGTYRATPRLRLRGLGIYHHLPKTKEGIDPFMGIVHPHHHPNLRNPSVEEGRDPSLKTFSAGLEYDFFDWLSANFVWERSNDTTLAYGNFPRGLFADVWWVEKYLEDGKEYRRQVFGLNHADLFPAPSYPYYNIFKTGLHLEPLDNLEIYLSYTYNEYNWAQMIDDNMNHIGFEGAYIFNNKLGVYLRYVYSRANNLRQLFENQQVVKTSHHSVFSEINYRMDEKSELVAQYGVGGYGDISTMGTYTPYGGGLATLDTQHIVRVYYRRKF